MAMLLAIVVEQLLVLVLDPLPPLREPLDQRKRHPLDLPHGPPVRSSRSVDELNTESVAQLVLDAAVVALGQRHRGGEESSAVQGTPLLVRTLHLVGDRHVRVQIRITDARVPVVEDRRGDAERVDLRLSDVTGPGQRRVLLQPLERVVDRGRWAS